MTAGQRDSAPGLSDVPETMLWTLHSRASEAARSDGALRDDKALAIYRSLDYDFERSFGRAEPTLALRALAFDERLRAFLRSYPTATIINLGDGLETQRYRVEAPEARWYSVDLPEAISVRERFIEPDDRHTHLAYSATSREWLAHIPRDSPIYVSAQGLFMYFPRSDVKALLQLLVSDLGPERIVFDVIPAWLAGLSRAAGGLPRTPRYRTPVMPWGVNRYWLQPLLTRWLGPEIRVALHDFPDYPRWPERAASRFAARVPGVRHWGPTIVETSTD